MSGGEIVEHFDTLKKESQAITKDVFAVCMALEGAMSLSDAWNMTYSDRLVLVDLLEERNKEIEKQRRKKS